MSAQLGKLCSLLLLEYFGETVEKVGIDLFRGGQKNLRLICQNTKLSINDVRQSLCILIKHGMVTFSASKIPRIAEYRLLSDKTLLLLRYPKYLILMKSLYGNEAEIIVEEVLRHGRDVAPHILLRSYKRMNEKITDDADELKLQRIRDIFEMLINKQYLKRSPEVVEKQHIPKTYRDESNDFRLPKIDMCSLYEAISKSKPYFENDVFWEINFDRFHQDMRISKNGRLQMDKIKIMGNGFVVMDKLQITDELETKSSINTTAATVLAHFQQKSANKLTRNPRSKECANNRVANNPNVCKQGNYLLLATPAAVALKSKHPKDDLLVIAMVRRTNAKGGEIMRLFLQQMYFKSNPWISVSNPVLVSELKEICNKSNADISVANFLEGYLAVMTEDFGGFLRKSKTVSLAYEINMKYALIEFIWCLLSNTVDAKYGPNAARIFRLIREQEFVEQDEIQKKAMLPDKEAKYLTYCLLQSGWIQQHELKKGFQKSGPTKTFYLFYIDFEQVVRMYVEICYKSLCNAIALREQEKMENKCLLEKKQRIDAIVLHMKNEGATDEQVAEIEEMVTPPEHALLEKIHLNVNKVSQAELQIDETLFILQLYLNFKDV